MFILLSLPPDTDGAIARPGKDEVIGENAKACDEISMTKAEVVDVVAVWKAGIDD